MLDPCRTDGVDARVDLRIDAESFVARITEGGIEVVTSDLNASDVVFTGTAQALAAVIYGGRPLDALIRGGALQIEGDRLLAEHLVQLFQVTTAVRLLRVTPTTC